MSQIRCPFIRGFSGECAKQVRTVLPFSQSLYVETNYIPSLFAVTSGDCYQWSPLVFRQLKTLVISLLITPIF